MIAGRILGMGDIVSLVEKAQETLEIEQAERMMKRFQKGQFNMNDLRAQLEQMLKMGGVEGVMGMMPGMGKMKNQVAEAGFDDSDPAPPDRAHPVDDQEGARRSPDPDQASRKKRDRQRRGMEVSDLNKLLKQHRQMSDMMKKMGKKGLLKQAMGGMFGGKGGQADMAKQLEGVNPGRYGRRPPRRSARCPAAWAVWVAGCPAWAAAPCPPASPVSARRSNDPCAVPHPRKPTACSCAVRPARISARSSRG